MSFIEKIVEKLTVKFSFLNRSNSSSSTQKISDSHTGHIVGRDINILESSVNKPSDLEKMALKVLYKEYKNSGSNHLRVEKLHEELEIKDGQYVGTLSNSKYIKLDSEYYITDEGIRYMDNLSPTDEILLPLERREKEQEREHIIKVQKTMMDHNAKNSQKNSAK